MAQPFHFTTDSTTSFDEEQDGTDATWAIDTGASIVTITGGNNNTRWVRKTDASVNSTVEGRSKAVGTPSMGVISNWQSATQFYLGWLSTGRGQLYYKDTTYTQIADVATTTSAGTYYRAKLTATTNGSNKDLALYKDGVSIATASTAVLYGSGRAGMMCNAAASVHTFDWFAFDTAPTITSILPIGGPSATATAITITGTDYGDGMLVTVGGQAATSVVVTPTTSLTANTPSNRTTTKDDVIVKFGTAGSEEYTATTTGGFIFGGGFAGDGFNGVV